MLNNEFGWRTTCIIGLTSLIGVHFFHQAVHGKKRRLAFSRYVLLGIIAVCAFIYFQSWDGIVCTVNQVELKGDKITTHQIEIITGKVLQPAYNDLDSLNKSNERCTLFELLNTHNPTEIWLPSSVKKSRYQLLFSFVLLVVLTTVLLVQLVLSLIDSSNKEGIDPEKRVFISYNHEDKAHAIKIAELLKAQNILTTMDVKDMPVGDSINSFVLKSIQSSLITVLIVSERSLLSGWVATETINRFFLESMTKKNSLVACYIDANFLDAGFANQSFRLINEKIDLVNRQIDERDQLGADSRDLNEQKTRLLKLKSNLDDILARLQNSLCLDISGPESGWEGSLIKAIRHRFLA